jgi:hypothetical protein
MWLKLRKRNKVKVIRLTQKILITIAFSSMQYE